MSKILNKTEDKRIDNIKFCLEKAMLDTSSQGRELFTYQELENILLDIYNLTN